LEATWLWPLYVRYNTGRHISENGGARFDPERSRMYGGLNHFDLLGHPAIAEQISEWISASRLKALPPA
jgi:hypothetical protein